MAKVKRRNIEGTGIVPSASAKIRKTKSADPHQPVGQPGSRLLSLPCELRNMIWKAVLDNSIYLMQTIPYQWEQERDITTHCSILPPSYKNTSCLSLHYKRTRSHSLFALLPNTTRPSPPLPGALSWLRTCRLICAEATPLLATNLPPIHICNSRILDLALDGHTPSFPFSAIKTLTLCVTIKVMSDYKDGFLPSTGGEFHDHMNQWSKWPSRSSTWFVKPIGSLETGRLHVGLECCASQLNIRPVIGGPGGDRVVKGALHRPRCQVPKLKWVGRKGMADVGRLVSEMCLDMSLLVLGRWVLNVEVEFELDGVRHSWSLVHRVRDWCWCRGRKIDEKSVPMEKIRRAFRQLLVKRTGEGEVGDDFEDDEDDEE